MTKKIYTVEEISLRGWNDAEGNEKVIEIYPLVISKFRKLAKILEDAQTAKTDRPFIDVMVDAVAFAMQTFEPELSDPEKLADYVDLGTLEYILDIAAGVKLDDPNLKAALATSGKN